MVARVRSALSARWPAGRIVIQVEGGYPDAAICIQIDDWCWRHPVWDESNDNEPDLGPSPSDWEDPGMVGSYLATWCLESCR